jgi:hypothetical protein
MNEIFNKVDGLSPGPRDVLSAILDCFVDKLIDGLPQYSRTELKTLIVRSIEEGYFEIVHDEDTDELTLELVE